ncbi:MAG TPA: thioredoxin [Rhodoblastus sp.]|nr:thioredoxin [Rhodoblastus sp.]
MRRMFPCLLLSAFLALAAVPAAAAELVVFERAGCAWCERWNAEVGSVYDKTAESRAAPLRRVDLARGVPADLAGIKAVVFTPTFVLVDKGAEIGRIEGYTDNAFFYAYLDGLIARLETPATN